jgi:hypothetical protein
MLAKTQLTKACFAIEKESKSMRTNYFTYREILFFAIQLNYFAKQPTKFDFSLQHLTA